MYEEEMTNVSFDVTKEEFEKLKKMASKHNMTIKEYVELRLEQIFKEDNGYFKF